MKTRKLVIILILIAAVLIIVGSCATGKKIITVNDAMKQFEGVYINTEYSGSMKDAQKIVIASDGRIERWLKATQTTFSIRGEYKIVESWKDSKGNIYCKVDVIWRGIGTKELWRLDKARITFERNWIFAVQEEHPTEINPNPDPNVSITIYYQIYYRQ